MSSYAASFGAVVSAPFEVVGRSFTRMTTVIFNRGRSWGGVFLGRTRIDYASEIGDPATNSVVGAVVGWIARNLPEAPVRIVRQGTTEEAFAPSATGPGAMLRLLENPNPYYSGPLQWAATIVDWLCKGDSYWLKQRSPAGRVVALWWVPWGMMEPRWPEGDNTVFIGWYEYTVDGTVYIVDPRDVVHFRNGINPLNPRKGISRLVSLSREIFTDDEASNFTASLLRNLGVPGVVISPANTTGPNVRVDSETVKTSFMEKFGGDKRGEPLVLTAPTDVKVLSFNPQQMELRELRRIPEERISAVLAVPASVVGLGAGLDQNAFTSYAEANVAAYTQGVIPNQRQFAADLERQLLPEFMDTSAQAVDVWFDWTKVSAMAGLAAALWKQLLEAATKGLITRAAFKRGTGQKVEPGDEVYLIANNINAVPVGEPTPPRPAPQRVLTPGTVPSGLLEAGELADALKAHAAAQVAAIDQEAAAVLMGAAEVRCGCGNLLAELAAAPYRFTCRKCKAVTSSGAPTDAVAA